MSSSSLDAAEIERRRSSADALASRRRRNLTAIREAREKLTSATGFNRAFLVQLARLYAQNRQSATMALVMFASVIGLSVLAWAPLGPVLIWVMIVMTAAATYSATCRRFLSLPAEDIDIVRWRAKFTLAELVFSGCWSTFPVLIGQPPTDVLSLFELFALLLFGAVSAFLSAAIPSAVYAGLLPISMAVLFIATRHGPTEGMMIGAVAGAAILFFVFLANRLQATALETISHRAEKDVLVLELEEARARSEEARKRAEDANIAKSRFLATMSHELRTPLNAILGFSEVMKNELFGPHANPQYGDYAKDIHESGEHLLALINEILDLSRIEAGRYTLNEEAIDLCEVVADCCRMLDIRAKARGQMIDTKIEDGLPKLWADERAVRQIILNLLSNATKFSPNGSKVLVKVGWTQSGGQYVSIRDQGPGIPEEEMETVMASFGRGSFAIKAAEQGSGLGLPIVKGLVQMHGGQFVLRSKLREGTEALVLFPAARVMTALAAFSEEPEEPLIVPTPRRRPAA